MYVNIYLFLYVVGSLFQRQCNILLDITCNFRFVKCFNNELIFFRENTFCERYNSDIIFIVSNFPASSSRNRYCKMMLTSHGGRHIRHNRHSLTGVDRERCKFRAGSRLV